MSASETLRRGSVNMSLYCGLLFALLGNGSGPIAGAAEITASWSASGNGNWSDPTKWSSNPLFPNNGADTFDVLWDQHPVTITLDLAVTIRNFTLNVAGTLSGAADLGIQGSLTLSQGTIAGSGAVNVSGPMLWMGGGFDGVGAATLNGGLTITNTATKTFQHRTVNSSGAGQWLAGQILSGQGMVFNNSGVFETSFDGSDERLGDSGCAVPPYCC